MREVGAEAEGLSALVRSIRACRICRDGPGVKGTPLPHEPRPVLQVSGTARLAICGQAPGTRVHVSGRPFTDPSGDRLRSWLAMAPETFYDEAKVAIVPMGFCFPGLDAGGSDLPPRRECATAWHGRLFEALPQVECVLLIGSYAQAWHLGDRYRGALTPTVQAWADIYDPMAPRRVLPLPHPSWRNSGWLKRHSWFEADLLPIVRTEVRRCL